MATAGLTPINRIVDAYMLKNELSTDRAWIYLQHGLDAVRDLHLYDLPNLVTEKVTISSIGIIEFPSDFIGFNSLYKFVDGTKWKFTKRDDMVVTTTTALGVEGFDDAYGEGEAMVNPKTSTYGGVGGVNDYYYNIDWKARRIFTNIKTDTAVLEYTTSGIELTGSTYIPDYCTSVIDAYLDFKRCLLDERLFRYANERERSYQNAENRVRNLINAMSYEEWRDNLLYITTMAPLR